MNNGQASYVSTWQQAEHNAAAWIRRWGWTDARVTETGPDGGIDVIGSGVVAQVKFKSSQTGAPDIQRLYGASFGYPESQMIFFSGSSYSQKAIEVADEMGIALFTYDILGAVTHANEDARAISVRRAVAEPRQAVRQPPAPDRPMVTAFLENPVLPFRIKSRRTFNKGTIFAFLSFFFVIGVGTWIGELGTARGGEIWATIGGISVFAGLAFTCAGLSVRNYKRAVVRRKR